MNLSSRESIGEPKVAGPVLSVGNPSYAVQPKAGGADA